MKWINTRAYVYILYLQVYVQHVQNVKLLISQMEKKKKTNLLLFDTPSILVITLCKLMSHTFCN